MEQQRKILYDSEKIVFFNVTDAYMGGTSIKHELLPPLQDNSLDQMEHNKTLNERKLKAESACKRYMRFNRTNI